MPKDKALFILAVAVLLWLIFGRRKAQAQTSARICYQLDDGTEVCEGDLSQYPNVSRFIQEQRFVQEIGPENPGCARGC